MTQRRDSGGFHSLHIPRVELDPPPRPRHQHIPPGGRCTEFSSPLPLDCRYVVTTVCTIIFSTHEFRSALQTHRCVSSAISKFPRNIHCYYFFFFFLSAGVYQVGGRFFPGSHFPEWGVSTHLPVPHPNLAKEYLG